MHALPGTGGVLRFLDTACWFHRAPGVTLVRDDLRTIDFILLLARMLSSSLIASNFYFERITHER